MVLSCDAYADVWPVFFELFFRYWPDCPFMVYLGANHLRYADERVLPLTIGDDESWAQSVRLMLERIDSEFVLVFLEDYLLTAPVDTRLVEDLLDEMRRLDAEFIRFSPSVPPDAPLKGHPLLTVLAPGSPYRVSLDVGLWRRRTLLSLLRDGESAWDMEIEGSKRTRGMSGFYAAKNNVLSRTNGLERGKWLRYNLPMLKRERIPLPAGREVMTHGESALRLCRSAFWRLWSSPLGQATMGRMRHRLHGRRVTGEASPSRPGPDVAGPPPTEEARSPAVSIIMATHNRASTLDRAITSVQRQTMSDWELIVVDDGSTDSSAELLRQLADPRIRVITHERNRGVCAAKNTGLDAMRGEWFTTLDSDDEIVPEALEAMLACAARTGATAITCNCRDAETGLLTGRGPGSDCRLSPEATARCRGEFWGLTRSELLGELRFDERLPGYEETVFLLINREARRFYLHEALRVYHTEGSDRVTKASGASSLAQKVDVHVALGEDHDYLCELGRVDFAAFARTYARIVIARCLRPFIGVHRRGSLPAR